MTARASRLEALDKKHLWHPFTQQWLWERDPALVIDRGRGAFLIDARGRRYLDGVSSLWVNLHGHRHPALDRALIRQIGRIAHSTFLGLTHEPGARLGEALARLARPLGLARTFYSDSGATAVEIALKMAFQFWIETRGETRPEFLALEGSYHGDTLGAVSVGGVGAFHSKFKPLLFKTRFSMRPACFRCPFNKAGARDVTRRGERVAAVPHPGDERRETGCRWQCLSSAENELRRGGSRVAAVIVEPIVQGASGMAVMPAGYVAGLARLAKRAGVLFIADEVATGFGRTGTLFACEQERVRPDILCLAKGITGGYLPLAATMTTSRVYRAFRAPPARMKTFFHGHSYTGNPLAAAVALESARLVARPGYLARIRRLARVLERELAPLKSHRRVASVRQAGLVAGIELVRERAGDRRFAPSARTGAAVCRALLRKGIWLRPLGDVIVIMPPAVISEADLARMVRAVRAEIDGL